MRRSMRVSEDEKEIKAPTGRRTRSLLAITGDCCLRRSNRINKVMENNPLEPGENSRVTRSRASTVEPEPRTPKSASKRDVRAGSETKTMTPGRFTRKTRASSVSISEDNLKDSLASWKPYGTPSRSNRRLSMLPSEPPVTEETQDIKAENRKSMEIPVIEIEDNTDEESSKEKVPEKIEFADSGGQVAIDSVEVSSPDRKMSTDSNTSPGKNGCDKNKLTNNGNENCPTSPAQTPRTFKSKHRSPMLVRREREMENSGTYEDYIFSENENESEKKKIETDRNRHSLKDSSVDTPVIVIDEVEMTSPSENLKSEEFSILVDKTATDRWISAEKENKKPENPRENDSDDEIDVCELSQKEKNEFSNLGNFLLDNSAQDSGLVRMESEESDAEIEVCDTKSIGKENIHNLNAVVLLQDILVDMNHTVMISSVKKSEENLQNFTPKKRQSLVGVEVNGEMKEAEARDEVEKEDSESGGTREEIEDVLESKDEEVPVRKDETIVSKSEETKASDEFTNLEDDIDLTIEEETERRGSSVEKERTKSFSSQEVENSPMERATGNFEEIMKIDVKESEEKNKSDAQNEESREKLEIPTKTPESSPVKISESSVKTPPVLKKSVTERPWQEISEKLSEEENVSSPSKTSSNRKDTIICDPLSLKSLQTTSNKNSPLKRCTVTISPMKLEKSVGTPDVSSKSGISSDKKKSELETFKASAEFSAEENPVSLSLQFEFESENGTTGVASALKINSDDVKSEVEVKEDEKSSENLNLGCELKTETLAFLSQSPKTKSPEKSENQTSEKEDSDIVIESESKSSNESENKTADVEMKDLSLRSERKTSESQNEISDFASKSLKNIEDEDSDLELKDEPLNPLSESPKKKNPEKSENQSSIVSLELGKISEKEDSDSAIEDENSKKEVAKEKRPKKLSKRVKEKSVSPLKRLSNGSVDKNLSEFQLGYRDDESESTDEEIEALETFEKIKALQLKEREAVKLKEELAALILKNESEILKLKEEMETSKSKEGLKIPNSEEFEPVKVKDVDFETFMSSAPENRGSSIVAGSPRKQTDEKEEELESLFKDITEEEFTSSRRAKNPVNPEEESEDIVLLDEEDAEEEEEVSKPLESRETFDDSSILILDHDRLSDSRNRGKRLSVEFMKHIRHSPKKDENLENETLRSPLINQSTENRRNSKSEGSSDGGKRSNGPVVRKIEILKTVIPLQTLKCGERKAETEVERAEIEEEEEVEEKGKKERKILNLSAGNLKILPAFLNNSTSSEEEDTDFSIDTDAAMEYNLPGHKISHVDDVTGDECRSSETEDFSSDSDDQGSLVDFIVNDDANPEVEETADLELETREENIKIKKKKKKNQKNRNKEESEINPMIEEKDENLPKKKKKQKKHKSKTEIEPEVEVEKKKKKKNRKREDKEEEKVESEIQIKVKSKKEKKMKRVLPDVPDEIIELEVPKKKKKRDKVLSEVTEENVTEKRKKKKASKDEEFISYEAKKEKKKKKKDVSEEIPQVEEEQVQPKKKKKKKTTEVEKFPSVIPQFDLPASSEESDKKKKKKRRKDKSEVEVPELKLQLSEPKRKHKKLAHDELLEFRNQERDIKEQEMKIRDQERIIKKQEIIFKGKEKIIQDREREIKNQERETLKEKKKKSKSIKRLPEEVLDSLSDLPPERKKQKLSNVDCTHASKKLKPSLSMIDKKCRKIPYLVEESESPEISHCGATSEFVAREIPASKLAPKKIAVLNIRDNLLKRRRHGFTFVSQVQNRMKKHLADEENMTEDTIRLEKSNKFPKNLKKANKK